MAVDVPALRAQFRADKAELVAQFRESRPTTASATRLLTQLARLVDRTLHTLWDAHTMPRGSALVAVGEYVQALLVYAGAGTTGVDTILARLEVDYLAKARGDVVAAAHREGEVVDVDHDDFGSTLTVVLDEAQAVKNPHTKSARAVRRPSREPTPTCRRKKRG